jgi:hypothetical protein
MYGGRVSWLRTIFALGLAVLWLPISMHCRLEQLPGFEILACVEYPDEAAHQDEDCTQDSCAVIESGLYRANPGQIWAIDPPPSAAEWVQFLANLVDTSSAFPLTADPQAPPGLACRWQFDLRTAPSPRAPSVLL